MFVLTLLLLLGGSVYCQSNNVWNGITPLKSTKMDVEKILGKRDAWSVARHAAGYETKGGKVFVLYSTGLCNVNPEHGWNIPELTVISVHFSPDYPHPHRFSDLKIDRSKFERRPDPGSLHLVSYTNETDGISLTVDTADDSVRTFGFFPASKDNCLRCENVKKGKSD